MAAPKSVVKMNKDGVQYTSSVDKCQYYIFELSRAALRDVGRFVKRRFKESFYSHFKKRTGKAPKATKIKVYSNANTKYPRLEIGLPHASKGNEVIGFYSYFQEFGTSKTQRLGLLKNTVYNNVPEIIKIESQYLSALEDEAAALALIDEDDYEGGADD